MQFYETMIKVLRKVVKTVVRWMFVKRLCVIVLFLNFCFEFVKGSIVYDVCCFTGIALMYTSVSFLSIFLNSSSEKPKCQSTKRTFVWFFEKTKQNLLNITKLREAKYFQCSTACNFLVYCTASAQYHCLIQSLKFMFSFPK